MADPRKSKLYEVRVPQCAFSLKLENEREMVLWLPVDYSTRDLAVFAQLLQNMITARLVAKLR